MDINNNSGSNNKNISIVVPYIHGLGKRFGRNMQQLGYPGTLQRD